MSESRKLDLVRDLARLLAKHSVEEWESLILALSDERRRLDAIEAIRAVMPLARRRIPTPQSGGTTNLSKLREHDPEKADVLAALKQKLHQKTFLPTTQSLREFAAIAGIKDSLTSRREQAISQIIRHLAHLPLPELNRTLSKEVRAHRDLGAEYDRWVEMILGPPRPKTTMSRNDALPFDR